MVVVETSSLLWSPPASWEVSIRANNAECVSKHLRGETGNRRMPISGSKNSWVDLKSCLCLHCYRGTRSKKQTPDTDVPRSTSADEIYPLIVQSGTQCYNVPGRSRSPPFSRSSAHRSPSPGVLLPSRTSPGRRGVKTVKPVSVSWGMRCR